MKGLQASLVEARLTIHRIEEIEEVQMVWNECTRLRSVSLTVATELSIEDIINIFSFLRAFPAKLASIQNFSVMLQPERLLPDAKTSIQVAHTSSVLRMIKFYSGFQMRVCAAATEV